MIMMMMMIIIIRPIIIYYKTKIACRKQSFKDRSHSRPSSELRKLY